MMVNINEALHRLKGKLAENFGAGTEIFLFGSGARGEYGEFSDVEMNATVEGIFEKDIVRLCDSRLRDELRQMADLLRGSSDKTDYKVVGLGLIFLKYV